MKKIIGSIWIVLFLTACEKPVEPPPSLRPALVMIVGKTTGEKHIVLVGEVKPRYESGQGFRIDGKIIERKVEVGTMVKKGQLLARLDAADTNLRTAASVADVRAAEANYTLARSEVERQRQLVSKKFISESALDRYEAELKTADARVKQARAQAAVSGNQSSYTSLLADRDGVVTLIRAEPGQVVEAGEMVARIADPAQLEVLVAVPESRVVNIKVGDAAEIKLWASQTKTYQGKVRELAPAANSATRAFDVRVQIDDPDDMVKMGMTAGVRFAGNLDNGLIIPSTALTQINGKNSVWVINKNGVAQPREVVAGEFTENGVVIHSGLQAGEMIATVGVHTLVAGQKVQPRIEQQP